MESVTVGGPGLVAVGSERSGDDRNAAVWTSPDGVSWTRVPDDKTILGGEGDQWMASVAAGGPGLVAVGLDGSSDDWDAVVWISPDGISWTRVPDDKTILGGEGDQIMDSVTVGGPGLVAVGLDGIKDSVDAAVWTSPDGIAWSRVPDDETIFGGEGEQIMDSLAVGGPGLIAVGWDQPGHDRDAAVWTSPDGISWTRVQARKD